MNDQKAETILFVDDEESRREQHRERDDQQQQQAQFATYLLSASIMNAPAAIVMSKIFLPELSPEKINSKLEVNKEGLGVNLVDSLAQGASVGVKLALNIAAMLLAFIAIIYAMNWILVDGIGAVTGLNEFIAANN